MSSSSPSSKSSSSTSSSESSESSQPDPPGPGDTPLDNPFWLSSYEDFYPGLYTKPGIAFSLPDSKTVFNEDNPLVAHNDSELAARLATAQSNDSINAIWLDHETPGATFHWPTNAGTQIFRPFGEPLVIRSHPDASRQRVDTITWNQSFEGVLAFVNLQAGFNITGGGEGLLIECCVGSITARGTSNNPIRNALVRLCNASSIDVQNYEGFLIEGCIVHRGSGIHMQSPGEHAIVRHCIISLSSGFGLRCSAGGRLYDSILLYNPIGVQLGFAGQIPAGGSRARSWRNIFKGTLPKPNGVHEGIAHYVLASDEVFIEDNLMLYNDYRNDEDAPGWHSCVHFDTTYESDALVARNFARQWYGDAKGPLTYGGTGLGDVVINGTSIYDPGGAPNIGSNNFDCSLDSAAQTIVDGLTAGYVDNLLNTQVGYSPIDLQSLMFAIFQGVS